MEKNKPSGVVIIDSRELRSPVIKELDRMGAEITIKKEKGTE